MIQENATILWNTRLNSDCFGIGIDCRKGYSDARPGQFVSLYLSDRFDPLLRRPFSIHRLIIENNRVAGIELLYKVIGKCTKRLSDLRPGEGVNILGPLGNWFTINDKARRIVMIAGGIGVAPMVFLARFLRDHRPDSSQISLFLGGRSKEDLLCIDDFLTLGIRTETSTDDGSAGHKGLVTDLFEKTAAAEQPDLICACGPVPMLKSVARIAERKKITCQISMEPLMACGIGVCLGCATRQKGIPEKYLHACIDGPVFDTDLIGLIG